MHICMYECMYIYIYIRGIYISTGIHICLCKYTDISKWVCASIRGYLCKYIYVYIYIYVCVCVTAYVYIYDYIRGLLHKCGCIYIYIHIYTCLFPHRHLGIFLGAHISRIGIWTAPKWVDVIRNKKNKTGSKRTKKVAAVNYYYSYYYYYYYYYYY